LFCLFSNAINFTAVIGRSLIDPPTSPFKDRRVGSHDARHNSTALCSHPLSHGPDFVSFHEGVFCDMVARRTWPLCSSKRQYGCYDWNTHTLADSKLKKRKMGYSEVIEWK
jgi:hypothetical protein